VNLCPLRPPLPLPNPWLLILEEDSLQQLVALKFDTEYIINNRTNEKRFENLIKAIATNQTYNQSKIKEVICTK